MPDKPYKKKKNKLLKQCLENTTKYIPEGLKVDQKKERKRILTEFEQVRNMSDVNFEVKKTQIAKRLVYKYETLKLEVDMLKKVEKFFLQPEVISLLQAKLSVR